LLALRSIPVTHGAFIAPAADPTTSRGYLDRLCAELLTRQQCELPFGTQLEHLEQKLTERQPLLGAGPEEDLEAVLSEQRHFSASSASAGSLSSDPTSDSAPTKGIIADDVFQLATTMEGFRSFSVALSTLDLTTTAGQLAAVDAAFSCGSILTLRLLCYGEKTLARRHTALAALLPCLPILGEYFGRGLSTDPTTGARPDRLLTYSLASTTGGNDALLRALLAGKFLGHNWYHDVGGVYHFKQQKFGTLYGSVKPEDYWCIPKCVTDFCEHMHLLLVLMGWPNTVEQGFTFKTWGAFYTAHLEQCTRLSNLDEQYRWMEHAHEQFERFLTIASFTVQSVATMPRPTEGVHGALAANDCAPAEAMRRKQANLETYTTHRDEWHWMGAASVARVDPEKLPRLSDKSGKSRGGAKANARETARAKREGEPRDASRKTSSGGDKPQDKTARWLTSKTGQDPQLLCSGRVWAIGQLAKAFNTTVDAKCWEVLCSGKSNPLRDCPCPDRAGHKSATDAAHVLERYERSAAVEQYSRASTPEDRAKGTGGKNSGRGGAARPKGGESKGKGHSAGGSHFRQPPAK